MSRFVRKSSGNVFADLGISNPDEAVIKALLAQVIADAIVAHGMSRCEAADILGIDPPGVSRLVRGQLAGFTLDWLFRCADRLGRDIKVSVADTDRRLCRESRLKRIRA